MTNGRKRNGEGEREMGMQNLARAMARGMFSAGCADDHFRPTATLARCDHHAGGTGDGHCARQALALSTRERAQTA
eukprot:28081-Pyramimonas_sp.AAC.1